MGTESTPNPDQQFLIKPEPDLRRLRDWIVNRLSRRPKRREDLHAASGPSGGCPSGLTSWFPN